MKVRSIRVLSATSLALAALVLAPAALVLAPIGAATAQAATSGAPLVLGTIGTFTGQAGIPGYDDAVPATLTAWAKYTNAHGGINGHPVKMIIEDDHGDQARSVADANTLISSDHVAALIGIDDVSLDAGWAQAAASAGVPVIGGILAEVTPWVTNSDFFPSSSLNILATGEALPLTAKLSGLKTWGTVLCQGLAACAQAIPLFKSGAQAVGVKFAYSALAPQEAPNYSAYCLAAESAGAKSLTPSGIEVPTFISNCTSQGYNPLWIFSPDTIYRQYLSSLGKVTAAAPVPAFPYFYKTSQTSAFQSALKKYTNVPTPFQGETQAVAWVSGLMVQRAVALSGVKGLPTSANIKAGLYKFKGETLGGLATPLTFTKSATAPNMSPATIAPCFFRVGVKVGKLVAPQGLKTACAPKTPLPPGV